MLAAEEIPADGYVSLEGAGEPAQILILKQLKPQLPPALYKNLKRSLAISSKVKPRTQCLKSSKVCQTQRAAF